MPGECGRLHIRVLAPVIALMLAIATRGAISYGKGQVVSGIDVGGHVDTGCVRHWHVHAVRMSGWSSNLNYALSGATRATAQTINNAMSMGLLVMAVVVCVGSLILPEISWTQRRIG